MKHFCFFLAFTCFFFHVKAQVLQPQASLHGDETAGIVFRSATSEYNNTPNREWCSGFSTSTNGKYGLIGFMKTNTGTGVNETEGIIGISSLVISNGAFVFEQTDVIKTIRDGFISNEERYYVLGTRTDINSGHKLFFVCSITITRDAQDNIIPLITQNWSRFYEADDFATAIPTDILQTVDNRLYISGCFATDNNQEFVMGTGFLAEIESSNGHLRNLWRFPNTSINHLIRYSDRIAFGFIGTKYTNIIDPNNVIIEDNQIWVAMVNKNNVASPLAWELEIGGNTTDEYGCGISGLGFIKSGNPFNTYFVGTQVRGETRNLVMGKLRFDLTAGTINWANVTIPPPSSAWDIHVASHLIGISVSQSEIQEGTDLQTYCWYGITEAPTFQHNGYPPFIRKALYCIKTDDIGNVINPDNYISLTSSILVDLTHPYNQSSINNNHGQQWLIGVGLSNDNNHVKGWHVHSTTQGTIPCNRLQFNIGTDCIPSQSVITSCENNGHDYEWNSIAILNNIPSLLDCEE